MIALVVADLFPRPRQAPGMDKKPHPLGYPDVTGTWYVDTLVLQTPIA